VTSPARTRFKEITNAGHRSGSDRDGKIFHVNFGALLWTRSAVAINGGEYDARYFLADSSSGFYSINRTYGLSIRCISIRKAFLP
jgi:hypothetical protein